MSRRFYSFIVLTIIALLCSWASWAQIKISTHVNAQKIGVEDILIVSYKFKIPRGGIEEQIPSFKGFRVVYSNKAIFNDDYEITFHLQPIAPGQYTIPEFVVYDRGGELSQSQPIKVKVVSGAVLNNRNKNNATSRQNNYQSQIDKIREQLFQQNPFAMPQLGKIEEHFFLRAETPKSTYYIGEPIPLVYKLYNNTGFTSANIIQLPNNSHFLSKNFDFEEDNDEKIESFNGRQYRTFVIKKAILYGFKVGTYEVGDLAISAIVDYFGRAEAHTLPLKITIKPLPQAPSTVTFHGGVGQFSISSSYNNTHTTVDDIISLKITITGNGNMEAVTAPEINWPEGLDVTEPIMDIVTHPSNPLISEKTFTYSLSSAQDTAYTIPETSWTYFDVKDNQYKTLSIPEQRITFFPSTKTGNYQNQFADYTDQPENDSSSRSSLWILGIIIIITAVLLWLFFRKKKRNETPLSPSIQEPVSPASEDTILKYAPPGTDDISINNNRTLNNTPRIQTLPWRDINVQDLRFNISYLHPEEALEAIEKTLVLHLQDIGLKGQYLEALQHDLSTSYTQYSEIAQEINKVNKSIQTLKYNPLPKTENDVESLLNQINTLSLTIKKNHH